MEWYWILLIVLGSVLLLFILTIIFYRQFFKRFWDALLSGIALIILSIPLMFVAIGVRMSLGKPVLFKTIRITKEEKTFYLLKFRSMKNAFDSDGVPLPDSKRITKFGRLIRRTSLDELPSLINIFKGDMSIVGPRPMPLNYLPWFKKDEKKRFVVRGGLTGLAQINGRGELDWETKFMYDCKYVDSYSFFGDISIIIKTVFKVFKKNNIGERGKDTPMDFHCYRSNLTEKQLLDLEKNGGLPKNYEEWINEKTANA